MPISFLTSALLGGLAIAALPLLVHLISRRRARRVKFAAMEFVLKSQRRTARNLRLRQFLLLLVRTLLVLAIALALTRPIWRAEKTASLTDAPLVVVVVVDVSGSMRAVIDGDSAFQRAVEIARERVTGLAPDVRAGLVACAATPKDSVAPSFDRARLLSSLQTLRAGFGPADLVPCVTRAQDLAALVTGEGERRVVVVSDLADHALGSPPGAATKDLVVEWVSVWGNDAPPNHGLHDLQIERSPEGGADALAVKFAATRFGPSMGDVSADLVVAERRVARVTLPLEDRVPQRRTFTYALGEDAAEAEREAWVAEVRLQDDALVEDNTALLPIDLPPPVTVLVVDGAPQPIPFRDEVFYLESALKNARSARARISLRVVGVDQVTESVLAESRVVLLANGAHLEESAAKAVTNFVRAGGGLLLTMGDQVDPVWSNRALAAVLPGRLRGAKGQALLDNADVSEKLGLGRFAKGHPIFTGLSRGEDGGLLGLSRVETTTLMLLEPDAKAPRDILVRFTNGAPALVEREVDRGRVMLWNTSIDRDWSDFAIRPGFLPLVEQVILYLGGALEERAAGVVEVGSRRRVPFPRGAATVSVRNSRDEEFRFSAEDAERPEGDEEGRAAFVNFRETRVPGVYRVFVAPEGGELRELTKDRFAVVFPRGESDLTLANKEQLEESAPQGAIVRGQGSTDNDDPLWPLLLLAAVAFVAIESVLLRRG